MDRKQAMEALDYVDSARGRVRRHTINNGVIPLVWGMVVLLTLPLFDFLASWMAALILAGIAMLAALWTAWYARHMQGIQPSRAATREYLTLILGWGAYYAVLMSLLIFFGTGWLAQRGSYPMTLLAPLAAAPLLIGGALMWYRGRS